LAKLPEGELLAESYRDRIAAIRDVTKYYPGNMSTLRPLSHAGVEAKGFICLSRRNDGASEPESAHEVH
jgi:hypothetical protein